MEMQLKKEPLSYLELVVCSGRELEQTQQIRLPEGMPDVGKVLDSFLRIGAKGFAKVSGWYRESTFAGQKK